MKRDPDEQIAWLMGQISVLGMAIQALLKHHPARGVVVSTLCESYEDAFGKVLPRQFPEAFLDGMKSARDLYLLAPQDDPGQPRMP